MINSIRLAGCLISILAQPVMARQFTVFSLGRLTHESDIIVSGTAVESEIVVSTQFVMTHTAKVFNTRALVRSLEVFTSTQPIGNPLVVICRDTDYFGGSSCPKIEKGATYLFFLKHTPEGYQPVQMYQGVALLRGNTAALHLGSLQDDVVKRFIKLSLSGNAPSRDWDRLGDRLVRQSDLTNSDRTRATFEVLAEFPNQDRYESLYVKGLHSRNSSVIRHAMYRIIMNGSEDSIRAMVKLYLKQLDAESRNEGYDEQHLRAYEFERFGQWSLPAKTKSVLVRLKTEFPEAPKFFEGI